MRHRLTAVLIVLSLAACGAVPQPFRPETPNPLSRPQAFFDVVVTVPEGAPPAAAGPLAEAVAQALAGHDIQAGAAVDEPGRYRVSATAEDNRGDPASPYVATITWTLQDEEGAPIGIHSQGVLGPAAAWQAGAPRLVGEVAAAAAAAIAQLIDDAEGELLPAPGSLRVVHVQGAPGDGDEALTGAMRRTLVATGYALAEEEAPAAYRLVGAVSVGAPVDGRQPVRIVWQVFAADGAPVGRATQENAVAAGSLDGRWGPTANAIAAAALPGIARVLDSEGVRP